MMAARSCSTRCVTQAGSAMRTAPAPSSTVTVRCRPLASAEVTLAASGAWVSADGVRYPSGWHIQVPSLDLDLNAQPLLADQELRTRPRYWEGAVAVSGTRGGAAAGGRGYVELVGYAQERCPRGATGAHGCVAR